MCLVVKMCWPALLQAQQIDTFPTTTSLNTGLETRLKQNDEELRRMTAPLTTSDGAISAVTTIRTRDVERPILNIPLTTDETVTVVGNNNVVGFVLTGKWITEYAKYIKLVPQYEKTLASYREQVDLQDQLAAEMQGALNVKDKKIEVLVEMNDSYKRQAELYKKIADEQSDKWYEKVLRRIAFPVSLAAGIIIGVEIGKN